MAIRSSGVVFAATWMAFSTAAMERSNVLTDCAQFQQDVEVQAGRLLTLLEHSIKPQQFSPNSQDELSSRFAYAMTVGLGMSVHESGFVAQSYCSMQNHQARR